MSEKNYFKPIFSKATFHAIALCNHLLVTFYLNSLDSEVYNDPDLTRLMKYPLRAFTAWNYVFQAIFLVSACIADWLDLYLPDAIWRKKLRAHSDTFFMYIVVPSSGLTSYMFWSLCNIDRNLVYPKVFDKMIPSYVNHSLHTLIIVVVLMELALGPRKSRVLTRRQSLGVITLLVVAFYSTLFYTRLINGVWLYGVYAHFNWYQMLSFIVIACWGALYIFEILGWYINDLHSETPCTSDKGNGEKLQKLEHHMKTHTKFS